MWAAANPPLCIGSFSSLLTVLMERILSSHLASIFPYPSLLLGAGVTTTSTLPQMCHTCCHELPSSSTHLQDRPNEARLSLHLRACRVPGTVTPHWVTAMGKTGTDMCSWRLWSNADHMQIGSTAPIPSRPDGILDLLCILPTSRRTEL